MAVDSSPQAILVANTKMRPLADRLGQLYNLCRGLQAQAAAEGWAALFPNAANTISDGSDVDGRTIITDADIFALIAIVTSFINFMEASSNANRNTVMKISVNPTQNV